MSPQPATLRRSLVGGALVAVLAVTQPWRWLETPPTWWSRLVETAPTWWSRLGREEAGSLTLDGLVTQAAVGCLVVALTGLAASLVLTFADVLTEERYHWLHRVSVAWCPLWGRRLVVVLCGVGVTLPTTGASSLADDDRDSECRSSCEIRVGGLPLPDLPLRERSVPERRPSSLVVRPGDSLWLIASRGLDRSASNAEVARSVDAWYAANAETIGPDPDLIFPGTHLDRPEDPS